MIRKLAAVALATSVVAVAAPAAAQDDARGTAGGTRPMGLRLETAFNKNFNLVGVGGDGGRTDIFTNSPQGDIKVGYDFGQITPLIGISFLNVSHSRPGAPGGDRIESSETTFILDVELRYYLKPHRKGLSPFVFGEFNTAFLSFDRDGADDDLLDAEADADDFTAVNAGIGMEYKFDGAAFAIGGKWGLGLGFKGTSEDNGDTNNTSIGTSAAIYAAWRL